MGRNDHPSRGLRPAAIVALHARTTHELLADLDLIEQHQRALAFESAQIVGELRRRDIVERPGVAQQFDLRNVIPIDHGR